jgi:hypothetical protein
VLLVADAAAHQAHHGLGDFQVMEIAGAGLPKILVVHEHREVHEVQVGQDREQRLPEVQDGNFAP